MDVQLQILSIFLGTSIGLIVGVIIGILYERNKWKGAQQQGGTGEKVRHVEYGTVDPGSIQTLPDEMIHEEEIVICPVCGNKNPPENMFCYDCGGRLN